MKKKDPNKITADTIMEICVHDDDCPFSSGFPCACKPTHVEMTVRQFYLLKLEQDKMGCKTLGQLVGHGERRN